jgi:PPOX class probable F420-dependent enzyme
MELSTALEFARSTTRGVLTTIRNDTRPQLSNIIYYVDDDGRFQISITATRAKYVNLVRRPWAALHVSAPDFWSYVVLEGDVRLSAVAADPQDDAVNELVELYRHLGGEHPNWDEYRRAMVTEQRVVASLTLTRAYGMLQLPATSGT